MRTIITLLLWGAFVVGYAQECALLMSDSINTMGLTKRSVAVDLDEVEIATLPIVFHVVHTGAGTENNISDEQVLSQLLVLNEEFEDSKIQFCIAARDPDGNPTTGITRYNASWNQEYSLDGVSNGSGSGWSDQQMKAASGCWNPDEYLNYYVVSEINGNDGGNGIQGYAYLGPTNDCRDGVVVLYNATGTVEEIKPGRTLGFTGVHEVGHYLSLWHTFSNSDDCIESNCETQGDQVCDTPVTLSNTSCTSASCPDALLENFMDYTVESCKESFTVGQSERMHEQLQTLRTELTDNLSCVPVVDFDATVGYAYYQEDWCAPFQDIWVDVVNQGSQPLSFVEVTLFCSGEEYSEVIFDMSPGSEDVLFEDVLVDGAQMFEVQVSSNLDQYPDNDYASFPLSVAEGDLMSITVATDVWGNETSWEILDENGEQIIADSDYPIQEATYEYEVCVYEGCYELVINDLNGDGFCSFDFNNDGVCDFGDGYFLATIGLDTVFYTGEGAIFSTYTQQFCNTLPACELDYDGNGTIGNGDVLVMLSYFGCVEACPYAPNQDGMVNVQDLLYMLWNVGDCPVEEDLSLGTYKAFFEPAQQFLPSGNPKIYDMTGRKVNRPFDQLPQGVYILKWKGHTKKVFVQ